MLVFTFKDTLLSTLKVSLMCKKTKIYLKKVLLGKYSAPSMIYIRINLIIRPNLCSFVVKLLINIILLMERVRYTDPV